MYPIKMASEVGCSEEFVTDSKETYLYQRKRPKPSYGSILGLKQIVTAVHVASTHLIAICAKLKWQQRILTLQIIYPPEIYAS